MDENVQIRQVDSGTLLTHYNNSFIIFKTQFNKIKSNYANAGILNVAYNTTFL